MKSTTLQAISIFVELRSGLLAFALLVAGKLCYAQEQVVVFVCEHGTVKSAIASYFAAREARIRGLEVAFVARGLTVESPRIPLQIARRLQEDGFDTQSFVALPLTQRDIDDATLIVTFGVEVSAKGRLLRWDDIPSATDDYPMASRLIQSRVDGLLTSLASDAHRRQGR